MTLKLKQLMVKLICSLLWTPRSSVEHFRTEVTCFSLNRGVSFPQNIKIPTYTTSEEWEREATLCRLIPPWNIASLLNALQLQQMTWCASFGLVRTSYTRMIFRKELSKQAIKSFKFCNSLLKQLLQLVQFCGSAYVHIRSVHWQ